MVSDEITNEYLDHSRALEERTGASPGAVAALVEALLRASVSRVERDRVGANNVVYFVEMATGRRCVVRVTPPEYRAILEREIWAMRRCRGAGVPVPEILAAELNSASFSAPFLLLEHLPGRPLHDTKPSPAQWQGILEQLGHYLALIHRTRVDGFGELAIDGARATGRSLVYADYVVTFFGEHLERLPVDLLGPRRAEAIRTRFDENRTWLGAGPAIARGTLAHGDYQSKNVLVEGGHVTGILDFENVVAAEPAFDFKDLHYTADLSVADFQVLQRGYGDAARFDEGFYRRLYLYEIILAVIHLWWYAHFDNRPALTRTLGRLANLEAAVDALI